MARQSSIEVDTNATIAGGMALLAILSVGAVAVGGALGQADVGFFIGGFDGAASAARPTGFVTGAAGMGLGASLATVSPPLGVVAAGIGGVYGFEAGVTVGAV